MIEPFRKFTEGAASPGDSDRDRIMRLIMARCGDVLSEADLAFIGAGEPDPDAIPGSIGLQILEVVEAFADRMDALESAVR